MKVIPIVMLSMSAAALSAYFLGSLDRKTTATAPPSLGPARASQDVQARAEIVRLAGELELLRRELANLGASTPGRVDPPGDALALEGLQPEPAAERTQDAPAGHPSAIADRGMEARFEEEVVDPRWAGEATLAIERALATWKSRGTELEELACRSSVCRMHVEHLDTESEAEFREQLPSQLFGSFASMVLERESLASGGVGTLVHLARPSDSLAQELAGLSRQ